MNLLLLFLILSPPLLALVYAYIEQQGWWDDLFGRSRALLALERLRTAAGHPTTFLYNDNLDEKLFRALEKRISKRTTVAALRKVLADGYTPSCITVAGFPVTIQGIPPQWDIAQQRVYTPAHSVLYLFGVTRSHQSEGKAERACSLGDLEAWLEQERESRKYYLGILLLGIVTITFIVLRYMFLPK